MVHSAWTVDDGVVLAVKYAGYEVEGRCEHWFLAPPFPSTKRALRNAKPDSVGEAKLLRSHSKAFSDVCHTCGVRIRRS